MTYLIVGLDRRTLAPWHSNVLERDAERATQAAVARASADGVELDRRGDHRTQLERRRSALTPVRATGPRGLTRAGCAR